MWTVAFISFGLAFAQASSSPAPSNQPVATIQADLTSSLLSAKRIYVESFGEDGINKTLQAMIIDGIVGSKRFVVTENKDRADLVLKGSSLEKTSQEFHSLDSATSVAGAAGGSNSQVSGQANAVGASVSGTSHAGFAAHKASISDGTASIETVNDARASVRIISKDGDVVWSSTQESKGAKYKGAIADVADKIVKQFMHDLAKLEGEKQGR